MWSEKAWYLAFPNHRKPDVFQRTSNTIGFLPSLLQICRALEVLADS